MFQDVSHHSSIKVLTIFKFIMCLNLQDVTTPVRSVSRAISRNCQVSGQPHDVS